MEILSYAKGDIVIVPLYWGKFSICEVIGDPIPISKCNIKKIKSWDKYDDKNANENVFLSKDGLFERQDEIGGTYDIGYLVPVKCLENK